MTGTLSRHAFHTQFAQDKGKDANRWRLDTWPQFIFCTFLRRAGFVTAKSRGNNIVQGGTMRPPTAIRRLNAGANSDSCVLVVVHARSARSGTNFKAEWRHKCPCLEGPGEVRLTRNIKTKQSSMSQQVSAEMNFANKSRQKPPHSQGYKYPSCHQLCHAVGGNLKALDNIVPALESITILSLDQNHLSY